MGDTKFGMSQLSKPAPQRYRNFSNAMIIFIIPGFTATISGWGGIADKNLNHILLLASFAPAIIKGIGTLLGNGQYYTSNAKSADVPPPLDELNSPKI